jgi:saccharopine dehydrogenase (NAD+, L-lysine forming)
VDEIKRGLEQISKKPKTTIIGSRGRCGQGASELLSQIQLDSINWNSKETSVGGPFIQLANCDILLNAIYLSDSKPKQLFLDEETILKAEQEKTRNLSVFVDVSCDCGNPKNPFPISEVSTTFDSPVNRLSIGSYPLDVIAIDHLPTLIPRESSEEYSKALLPHLKTLKEMDFDSTNQNSTEMIRVWQRARDLYYQKSKDL